MGERRWGGLIDVFETGAAIVVATADDKGRPSLTRGWGPVFDPSSTTVEIAVTAPPGSPTLENLEANGRLSVTASQPTTYRTMQMSGTVHHLGTPSDDDLARVAAHLDRFVAEVAAIGVTWGAEEFFLGDLVVVGFVVDELYDQTPGERAGSRL